MVRVEVGPADTVRLTGVDPSCGLGGRGKGCIVVGSIIVAGGRRKRTVIGSTHLFDGFLRVKVSHHCEDVPGFALRAVHRDKRVLREQSAAKTALRAIETA